MMAHMHASAVNESDIHFFSHFANLFCFVARYGSGSLDFLDSAFSAFPFTLSFVYFC